MQVPIAHQRDPLSSGRDSVWESKTDQNLMGTRSMVITGGIINGDQFENPEVIKVENETVADATRRRRLNSLLKRQRRNRRAPSQSYDQNRTIYSSKVTSGSSMSGEITRPSNIPGSQGFRVRGSLRICVRPEGPPRGARICRPAFYRPHSCKPDVRTCSSWP